LFLSRSKRLTFNSEHHISPGAHLASCSANVVDPSRAMKQLMHEADHPALFSAEVTVEMNVLPMNVFMVYAGTFLSLTIVFGGTTPISAWT